MGWCSLDFYQQIESDEKVKKMGFEICEWGPEPDDFCERCRTKEIQMYYSGDASGEGMYWCRKCVIEVHDQNERDARHLAHRRG